MIDTLFLFTGGIYGVIILCYVTGVFLLSRLYRDNSIMDVFYGPAFAAATWGTMWLTESWHLTALIAASLVTVWAARLSIRIGKKNLGAPEDARYAAWRSQWREKGALYFIVRSYLQVNILQGIIITLVSVPLILLIADGTDTVTPVAWLGIIIFSFGLLYETMADSQLDAFIARKKAGTESSTLMTQGLFAYSRRPNYFGESLIWWGLAVIAVGTLPLAYGWIAFLGPLCITYILTSVTGPMLEKQFLEKYPSEYQAYIKSTNYLIPGPPQTNKD